MELIKRGKKKSVCEMEANKETAALLVDSGVWQRASVFIFTRFRNIF